MNAVIARPPLPARSDRRALWCAGVLSVGLHLLLVVQIHQPVVEAPAVASASRKTISVSLLTKASAGETGKRQSTAETANSNEAQAPSHLQDREPLRPPPASHSSDLAAAQAGGSQPSPAPASPVIAPEPDEAAKASSEEGYLPRPMLTRPPVVLGQVRIAEAESNAPMGHYVGVLSLFIDEQGKVRHVRAEPSELTPEMVQAAEAAFSQAQFAPGEVDGRAVRSRLRVEVSIDHVPRVTEASAKP